jgi:hypothetical protein
MTRIFFPRLFPRNFEDLLPKINNFNEIFEHLLHRKKFVVNLNHADIKIGDLLLIL